MDQITLSETGCRLVLDAAEVNKETRLVKKMFSPAWTSVIVVALFHWCGFRTCVHTFVPCLSLWVLGIWESKTEGSHFHSLSCFALISSAPFSMCKLPLWSSAL
jgi:hypothetical protein